MTQEPVKEEGYCVVLYERKKGQEVKFLWDIQEIKWLKEVKIVVTWTT